MTAGASNLAQGLLAAVRAQDFGNTPDAWGGDAAVAAFPSIDLAVADFALAGGPRWANVLFSREFPRGLVAAIGNDAGAVSHLRFDADQQNARHESVAWLPGADWSRLHWTPIDAARAVAPRRFVAPYPASLLKLMIAVGVGLAVERGLCEWPAALEPMVTVSDNDATDDCVALLHRVGLLSPGRGSPLNTVFAAWSLGTLQVNDTTPRGGWRNAGGAGVGHIHMTAWDTVRLLWLLDPRAPPAPWLPAGTPTLQTATRDHLHAVLARQQRDEVLSSGRLRGLPGWVPGLPDAPAFAHKTGSTDTYASDAGIVTNGGRHYAVAVLTSLGRRYAPHEGCATTWRLPALGAAIDTLLAPGAA
ncbi:MAG: class A beta-lactamase-related serine hydrolase [Burkholderiaceae bacterium]|nr:class A beta-lactamase-related serine hydrolase [Burkholderiaceae bacterium]